MPVRDHSPLPMGPFKGLWRRGDPDNVPLDHFEDGDNLLRKGKDWESRPGIAVSQDVVAPLTNIKRGYNFPRPTSNDEIILVYNDTTGNGEIYHLVNDGTGTVYGPILTKAGMTDFAFVPYAGRGYISPFGTFQTGDINIQKGLQNEFLYVYLGAGAAARKAAGAGPTDTPLTIANGAAGHTDAGFHLFGTVFEYDSGYLSPIKQITGFNTSAGNSVSFAAIQSTGDATVVRVHVVATAVIPSYNGNTEGYEFFFIPNATVNNGTLVLNNVSFFDEELIDSAWHLLDNYTEIPAGCGLNLYHDRLVLNTTYDDLNLCLVSAEGEPEAISQVDGLLTVAQESSPLTCTQELRDVLYVGRRTKVIGYTDNGDVPSSWPDTVIDTGRGWPVHGIGAVLDSGGTTVDYLIVGNFAGVMIFNGKFIQPELSYKVSDIWAEQDRNLFRLVQIAILTTQTQNKIYIVLPDGRLLVGDFADGLNHKDICWDTLSFYVTVNCVLIVNVDDIILGMDNPNANVPDI